MDFTKPAPGSPTDVPEHYPLHQPRPSEAEPPVFDRPVAWDIARSSIPEILEGLGEHMPELRATLQKAAGSRYDSVTVFMMPEEAKEVWYIFEARRANAYADELEERLKNDALT